MKFTIGILLLLFLVACKQSANDQKYNRFSTKYARYFTIISKSTYKEIVILNPENQQVEKRIVVYKGAKPIVKNVAVYVKAPIQSIAALTGTDIGMINKLGKLNTIKAVTSKNYLYNGKLIQKVNKGEVIEVGDLSLQNPENFSKHVSFVSYSGFGKEMPNEEKMELLGVFLMPNYDWREEHPLGKAEWIKLFGVLFDCEKKADEYFRKIESKYQAIKKKNQSVKEHPIAISGEMIGDFWYMPKGNSYQAQLFKDAGIQYVAENEKGTGSIAYTIEDVLTKFKESDLWFNVGLKTKNELVSFNSTYRHLKPFQKNQIYSYSPNMNYFWEMSAIEPHKILEDLSSIAHSDKKSKLHFYKRLQ